MEKKYKVGNVTDFGLLLTESVKYDNSKQTVSLYENSDKSGYTLKIWDTSDNGDEYEYFTTFTLHHEGAVEMYLWHAFGVEI